MGDWDHLSYEDWLALGQSLGYCTKPVCSTHDGLPNVGDEEERWNNGEDPCVPAVRLL